MLTTDNMKAKIKPRINLDDRTRLEEVIPLSTPMILFIDPSNLCNFKCKFCPTGHPEIIKNTGRWQGQMNFDLYKKIIDDLREFDKPLKVLRLYKEGEPLLNRKFADMVSYAKKSGMIKYIDTTTNGYLLKLDIIKPIIDAGLDRINISVCGMSEEQFLKFSGIKVNFDKFVDNIVNLYKIKGDCEVCIKITGDFMTKEEKERFFNIFGDHTDRIFVENAAPCWPEFDVEKHIEKNISKIKGIYDQPIGEDIRTCPYIFYSVTINSSGSVSLCFLDWAQKLIIGDIRKQSLKDIWEGDILFQHQFDHLNGKRKENMVCSQCGQLSYCLPDNIDPYVDILTDKLLSYRQRRIS